MGIIVREDSACNRQYISVYNDDGTVQRISREESIYITEEIPVDERAACVCVDFAVNKSRESEQLVSGWANVAINADGSLPLDWQDDIILPETLEKAAINFMLDFRASGEMHQGESKATVVESIVFTKEKQAILGIPEGTVPQGWFITVKVHDPDVFAKVVDGTYRMFSIQGTCRRVKV